MNIRQRKLGLFLIAALLAVIGVGVVVGAVLLPIKLDPSEKTIPGSGAMSARPAQNATEGSAVPPLGELALAASRPLRLPLHPALEPVATGVAASNLSVRLAATAQELGESRAVFIRSDGSTAVCPVGQTFETPTGTVKVVTIELDQVTVEFAGKRYTLQAPESPNGSTP